MKYSNLDEAIPMIRCIEMIKGRKIDISSIDLNTIGKTFHHSLFNMPPNRRVKPTEIQYLLFPTGNPMDLIGKWAYFSALSQNDNYESYLGVIIGARDTNMELGIRYFLYRPHLNTFVDITDSSPHIFYIGIESPINISALMKELYSNYLHAHCTYNHNESVNKGHIKYVSEKFIYIVDENSKSIKIPTANRKKIILNTYDKS